MKKADTPKKGEGDYESAERYQKDAADFAKSGKVEPAANDAKKAREGAERPELDRAEAAGRARAKDEDR